jgi:hypothetical protein
LAIRVVIDSRWSRASRGSSVFVSGIKRVRIQDSDFIRSYAIGVSGIGGGIYVAGTSVTITRSKFVECSAWRGGGAIYMYDASLDLVHSGT